MIIKLVQIWLKLKKSISSIRYAAVKTAVGTIRKYKIVWKKLLIATNEV